MGYLLSCFIGLLIVIGLMLVVTIFICMIPDDIVGILFGIAIGWPLLLVEAIYGVAERIVKFIKKGKERYL